MLIAAGAHVIEQQLLEPWQRAAPQGGGESARPTTANELLRMLREPLHRAAGGTRHAARWSQVDSDAAGADERAAEAAFFGDAAATDDRVDRVFAPAAAALDLHVARMRVNLRLPLIPLVR